LISDVRNFFLTFHSIGQSRIAGLTALSLDTTKGKVIVAFYLSLCHIIVSKRGAVL